VSSGVTGKIVGLDGLILNARENYGRLVQPPSSAGHLTYDNSGGGGEETKEV
jgi:hypothetical protein